MTRKQPNPRDQRWFQHVSHSPGISSRADCSCADSFCADSGSILYAARLSGLRPSSNYYPTKSLPLRPASLPTRHSLLNHRRQRRSLEDANAFMSDVYAYIDHVRGAFRFRGHIVPTQLHNHLKSFEWCTHRTDTFDSLSDYPFDRIDRTDIDQLTDTVTRDPCYN